MQIAMAYVNLGRPGLKVSRICLGCMSYGSSKWRDWVLDYDASKSFFKRALELGINFFDTADMYSDGEGEVASSMYAYQFTRMLHASDTNGCARFVTMQNHYNLVYREEERD